MKQPRRHRFTAVKVTLALVVLVVAGAFFVMQPAVASRVANTDVLGIGSSQMATDQAESQTTLAVSDSSAVDTLRTADEREITVKDPDPVVLLTAVDTTNANTVALAQTVGTTDPLPTAPIVDPDVNDGTWSYGLASAYNIADNSDGNGNLNSTATASGVPLTSSSLTVAVPASQIYLLGRAVAIYWNGITVVATVTDTGGFAVYGRALDLAPGVWQAFGYSSVSGWGVQGVYYKFL